MKICDTFVNDLEIKLVIETLEYQQKGLDSLMGQIEALHADLSRAREMARQTAAKAALASLEATYWYQTQEARLNEIRASHEKLRRDQQHYRAILDRVTPNILKKWFRP